MQGTGQTPCSGGVGDGTTKFSRSVLGPWPGTETGLGGCLVSCANQYNLLTWAEIGAEEVPVMGVESVPVPFNKGRSMHILTGINLLVGVCVVLSGESSYGLKKLGGSWHWEWREG